MVKGEFGINFVEKDYTPAIISNNRSLICLVAPFKDASFKIKAYANMKEALNEQRTEIEEAVGFRYLEILSRFRHIREIVLMNTTTENSTGDFNYEMNDDKFADVFEELEDARYNSLALPFELTETQAEMYRVYRANKKAKMEFNGAYVPLTPNSNGSNIKPFTDLFTEGGIDMVITTPAPLADGTVLNLPESAVWYAGFISGLMENEKVSMRVLPGVVNPVTREVYNKDVYTECIENGAIATKYIDTVRKIVAIANANTPTGIDLRIQRVHNLIGNEMREEIEKVLGETNNETITYGQFQGIAIGLREKYANNLRWITGLEWNVSKAGRTSVDIRVKENQDDVIQTINVFWELEIND